jgi:hypothetical protein
VYLSGQGWTGHAIWHASGEGALLLVAPSYGGAVTVTGHRLSSTGKAYFGGAASTSVAPRAPQAWWRYWRGPLSFDVAGCYQLDISGGGLHESVVVQVVAGQPPPG